MKEHEESWVSQGAKEKKKDAQEPHHAREK
jgi:hypothetical protein